MMKIVMWWNNIQDHGRTFWLLLMEHHDTKHTNTEKEQHGHFFLLSWLLENRGGIRGVRVDLKRRMHWAEHEETLVGCGARSSDWFPATIVTMLPVQKA